MEREELEDVEIQLLLEGIYRYYGFDFRNYALASLKRRIWNTVKTEGLTTISGLQEKVLHEPEYLERLLLNLSINVTAMFRNPNFFLTFRKKVIPILRTYPFIRIWHAGCSTGEEVYSMAILLKEEGLYHRSRLYATDINEIVLRKAKSGIFPLVMMQEYTHNYIQAGGNKSFSEYYTAAYGNAIFSSELKENIIF
ncbi:chemotaxis protein CheR, partial [Fischerella thermalis CCMEE 5273]